MAIQRGATSRITGGRCSIGLKKKLLDGVFDLFVLDNYEVPGLHESHGACMMRRFQQPREHGLRNWRRKKIPSHIAALKDGPIYRRAFPLGKCAVVSLHVCPFAGGPSARVLTFSRHGRQRHPPN